MRRRRLWVTLLGILASLVASLICAAWPGSSTFTVSTETTHVTGPLDKHGYVDYVTALNERLRGDITPESNANVLIWKALGPRPEGGTTPDEYFKWLGIECPPEHGEYWVTWRNYLKAHLQQGNGNANAHRELTVFHRPWTPADDPELADWLKQNEKPLSLITEATRRSEYYNPLVPNRTEEWSPGLPAALLPTVQQCREVAAALVRRALLRVAEGNIDNAWQDLLTCHRLSRMVARGGTLIELLVGIAVEFTSEAADVSFLEHANLTSKQILACWEDVRALPPMATVADKLDLTHRFILLDTMMLAARHGAPFLEEMSRGGDVKPPKGNQFTARLFSRSINWDPAFRIANGWHGRCAAALRITDRTARAHEVKAVIEDLKNLKRQVANIGLIEKSFMNSERRGATIGNILISSLLPAFQEVQGAAERCEQGQRNLHLAFALAAYQRDNGRYPEKLDDLAPKYLDKVPNDLFSDKPLIYRLEGQGYLLYSVGLNGIDEDGRGYGDEPRGDDLSVRVPVPEPRPKD